MMIRTAVAAVLAGGSIVAGGMVAAAGVANHDVPSWMRQECASEDSVNCYWPGGSKHARQGEAYVRKLPGTHKVCVLYVNRPGRDYCERRR